MKESTAHIRQRLSEACTELQSCVEEFKIQCGIDKWNEKIVSITDIFTEIFPGIMAKVAFTVTGSRTIIIKAAPGSKIDLHKMVPLRFVYVVHGDQRDEAGVIVLGEDEGMTIKPLVASSMYFGVDTKLIMQIESE